MAFSLSNIFAGSATLVFTHDHFVLRGALVRKKNKSIEIIAEAESKDINPEQALMEVLEGLKEVQKRLPKKATLATAAMISGVFELPVNPKKPKPPKQMQALARYELSEGLGDYNDQWTLGAVAVGRGYITAAQRLDVVHKIAEQRAENEGGRPPRFGDIAIGEKYLTTQQHDDCLDVQEQLAEPDDDLICAWKPFTLQAEDETETHNWYCAGMGRFYRNQWARAFKTEGIKITGFTPMTGFGTGLLAKPLKDNESTLLLELLHNQVLCYRLKKDDLGRKGVSHLRLESRSEGELDEDMLADLCLEHIDDSLGSVSVCIPFDDDADLICQNLETRLDRPVKRLSHSTKFSGMQNALAGVAGGVLYSSQGDFLLQVPAFDPPPALYKNPAFLRFAIPALLFTTMGANEAYTRFDTQKMEVELDGLKSNTKQTTQLSAAAAAVAEAKRLKDKIRSGNSELSALKKEIARLQKIYVRSSMPVEVLQVLGRTVRNNIMLEKFIEPRRSKTPGFHLHAWAVDDISAQSFVDALDRNLVDIDHKVVRRQVFVERNRYGISGSGIDLWVIPAVVTAVKKKGKKK